MFFALIGLSVFIYALIYIVATFLLDCDVQLAFYEKFGKTPNYLRGKVVFITGASSGIGENIAYALAKHGVRLVLTARRSEELHRVKNNCITASKGALQDIDVLVITMDVTDMESHKQHFFDAVRYFGTVDILVNNAGRSQRALWENIELPVDRQLFDLNVFGVVNLTRVAMEHFNKKGSGHIAVVSSLAGIFGVPYSGSYTGSKHAIHGYFNSLRTEKMGKNITVSLLCPGPTFTNFLSESFTETAGQKYNISVEPTDRRMTSERCGELCSIALANKLNESWMGRFPIMVVTYTAVFFPQFFNIVLKMFGPEKLFKLRDSKAPVLKEMKRTD